MQFTSAQKRAAAWAMIAVLTALVLWLLAPVLTPFVVAAVLAYALTPLVNRLDSWFGGRMPRVVAVILVEALFLLVLLAVLLLILPILVKEMPLLREQVPVLFDRLNETVKPFLAQFGIKFALDVGSIKAFALKYLNANVEDAFGSVMSSLRLGGSVAFAILGNAVLIPVALFYLLMDSYFLIKHRKSIEYQTKKNWLNAPAARAAASSCPVAGRIGLRRFVFCPRWKWCARTCM